MPKIEQVPVNKRDYKKKLTYSEDWFLMRGDKILKTWPERPTEDEIFNVINSQKTHIGSKFTLYYYDPRQIGHEYSHGYHDVYYYFPHTTWEMQRTISEQLNYIDQKEKERRKEIGWPVYNEVNVYAEVRAYPRQEKWDVKYYENGKLVDKLTFNNRKDFHMFLWETGGYDFLIDEEGKKEGPPVDYNTNNIKWIRM